MPWAYLSSLFSSAGNSSIADLFARRQAETPTDTSSSSLIPQAGPQTPAQPPLAPEEQPGLMTPAQQQPTQAPPMQAPQPSNVTAAATTGKGGQPPVPLLEEYGSGGGMMQLPPLRPYPLRNIFDRRY